MKIYLKANEILYKLCYCYVNRKFSGIVTYTPSAIWLYNCLFPTSAIRRSYKSFHKIILSSTKPNVHVVTRTFQDKHLLLHTTTHAYHPHTSIYPKYHSSNYLISLHTSTYVHSPYPVYSLSVVHTQRIKLKIRQSSRFEHSHSLRADATTTEISCLPAVPEM